MSTPVGNLSEGFVGLAQQIVGNVVRRVHFERVVQIVKRLDGVLELQKRLAQQNIRCGGPRFQQHGAVQCLLGVVQLAAAQVGVAQPVIQHAIERIDLAFGIEFFDGAGQVALGQGDFSQQLMSQGKAGVDLQGLASLRSRLGGKLTAQQHAACQQVGLGGVGRKAILGGEGMPGIVVAARVGIAQAQHIFGIDVGAFHGGVRFLEEGNGLDAVPQAKQAHPVHLHGFPVVRVLGDRLGKGIDGIGELLALIEDDAAEPFDAGLLRALGGECIELRHGLVEPSAGGQVLGHIESRRRGSLGGITGLGRICRSLCASRSGN